MALLGERPAEGNDRLPPIANGIITAAGVADLQSETRHFDGERARDHGMTSFVIGVGQRRAQPVIDVGIDRERRDGDRSHASSNRRPSSTSREAQVSTLHRTSDTMDQTKIDLGMPIELLRHILDEQRPVARSERPWRDQTKPPWPRR
jgi:hypothetical protein